MLWATQSKHLGQQLSCCDESVALRQADATSQRDRRASLGLPGRAGIRYDIDRRLQRSLLCRSTESKICCRLMNVVDYETRQNAV